MTGIDKIPLIASLLLGLGLWMLLPRGSTRGKAFGLVLTTAAMGLFAYKLFPLDDLVSDAVFYVMAAVTLVSAVGAVTMRSPVYCAIWFALTLLGTAGLFFFQGAQFLGVATIVVAKRVKQLDAKQMDDVLNNRPTANKSHELSS